MNKRRISLGFNVPKALEPRVIYVNFSPSGHNEIRASALSDTPFNYTSLSLAGNRFSEFKAMTSTYTGDIENCWERNYHDFLEELVQLNDGEIDYSRLIQDGVSTGRILRKLTNILEELDEKYKPK